MTSKRALTWLFAAALIVNALYLSYDAFRILYFLDAGSYLFGGWRIANGWVPYTDFVLKCGSVYFYFNAFLFLVFGFGKTAVLTHVIIASSTAIACSYAVIKKYDLPVLPSALVLCLTTVSFFWSFPFPLLTQLAHMWGILGAAWLILQTPFTGNRRAFWSGAICGLLSVICFMTKFNTGGAYGIVFFAVLLVSGRFIPALLGFAVGVLAGVLYSCAFLMRNPYLFVEQALGLISFTYHHTGRVQGLTSNWKIWLTNNYAWVALIVTAGLWKNFWRKREWVVLFFGMWFVGIFSTYTSTLVYEQDVELMGLYSALAYLLIYKLPVGWLRKISSGAMTCLMIYLIGLYGMYGIQMKGFMYPDTVNTFAGDKINPNGSYAMKTPELKGWLTKPDKGPAVDGLTEFIKNNVDRKETMLVLTDLQILYPLTDRDNYKLMPVFWGIDVAPARGAEMEAFRKAYRENPPTWIVTHRGKIAYLDELIPYLGLAEDIQSSYVIAKRIDNYIILRRFR